MSAPRKPTFAVRAAGSRMPSSDAPRSAPVFLQEHDAHITPIGHCPVRNGGIYVAVSERLGSVLGKLEVRSGGRIANVLLDRGEIAQLRVALDDLDAALSQTTPSKGTKP